MLSLNVISAPVSVEGSAANPLINYDPDAVVQANRMIAQYVPIIQNSDQKALDDQVASAVAGPQTSYVPKPLLPETVDHRTADLMLRGLRHETVTHTVQQGETMSQIATEYGINIATILKDNHMTLSDLNKIKPGAQLTIAPESSSDAVAWLDKLKTDDAKAKKLLADKQAKLAAASKSKQRSLISTASADNGDSAASAPGKFIRPIVGARYCQNGYHWWAIDCPAPIGSEIMAAAGGVVTEADGSGYNGGYGKTIVISHGNGWETRYAHMSDVEVSPGQSVSAGQEIGLSGNTGNSTGPHLHFETHYGGTRINPINVTRL